MKTIFKDKKLCNSFHWLVHLDKENELNEPEIKERYEILYEELMDKMAIEYPEYFTNIQIQLEFRQHTVETAYKIRNMDGKNDKQVAELKKLIQNGTNSDLINLNGGKGVPLSANLDIELLGVRAEKVKVFTSATKPLLLPFYWRYKGEQEQQPETFTMMFKTGDDMRQDALVLQLFSIMDAVLKEVGLDMKFTIYNLIPFTRDDGLLQFVP